MREEDMLEGVRDNLHISSGERERKKSLLHGIHEE